MVVINVKHQARADQVLMVVGQETGKVVINFDGMELDKHDVIKALKVLETLETHLYEYL